ncbi:hypothetical protein [Bosea sp. 685]|uniref:hypothetical protein n=1 Tax=Bosea sp. 685 TaxID=3080057 RepID=UPI002892F591|nr:hypothetical protein [Bosea sp. 685]WNJ87907.1 hypothetical protein RMR04_00705 [Bosea sp. 685]
MAETASSADDERFALLAKLLWSASDHEAAPQQSAMLIDEISQLLWAVSNLHQPYDPSRQ